MAEIMERLELAWYLTGSEALAAYAAPRQTLDADVVIDSTVERLGELARELRRDHHYAEPLRVEKRWMASLVDRRGGGKVGLIVRHPDPWGREAMTRRHRWDHPAWGRCESRVWRTLFSPSSNGRRVYRSYDCVTAACFYA
ncbi:MAG: hypothetical protein ACC726_00530 [Chloroflexota bacterium]